jgi:hypothetical protein
MWWKPHRVGAEGTQDKSLSVAMNGRSALLSGNIIHWSLISAMNRPESILEAECESLPRGTAPQLEAFSELSREKIVDSAQDDASKRASSPGLYMLGDALMNQAYWADAEIALDRVIELSLANNESYFLDDSRTRRPSA